MAIEMVRVPSETPNISNTDDFVGLRYAYGNQNGYVINKGLECSFTPLSAKFRINSGRLVLQGVEVDINADGVEVAIDNVANTQYHTVYLQVDLSTNEAKILTMSDTSTYPTIESGDDLTQNTTGIAKMELYRFDATSGVISNVQNIVEKIDYTGTALVDYDISKGTVEERLDALGFKQGSVTVSGGTTLTNSVVRYGNVCMIDISWEYPSGYIIPKFSVGNQFLPDFTKTTTIGYARCKTISYIDDIAKVNMKADGTIEIIGLHDNNGFGLIYFKVSYMAKPL